MKHGYTINLSIFIDLSFLHHKKQQILEQQQQSNSSTDFSPSFNPILNPSPPPSTSSISSPYHPNTLNTNQSFDSISFNPMLGTNEFNLNRDNSNQNFDPYDEHIYKKTVVYDPSKSETYRAIQEENFGDYVHEVPHPVQPKVYSPNRVIHGKPGYHGPPPQPHFHNVNALGESNDCIHQSGSFKRLMYSVMGETTY